MEWMCEEKKKHLEILQVQLWVIVDCWPSFCYLLATPCRGDIVLVLCLVFCKHVCLCVLLCLRVQNHHCRVQLQEQTKSFSNPTHKWSNGTIHGSEFHVVLFFVWSFVPILCLILCPCPLSLSFARSLSSVPVHCPVLCLILCSVFHHMLCSVLCPILCPVHCPCFPVNDGLILL